MEALSEHRAPLLLLRSEPFGGIVADRFSYKVRFYNHTAFYLIEQIVSSKSDEDIILAVNKKFDGSENQDISAHIDICREGLLNFLKDDGPRPIGDDLEESVPTLKAPLDLELEITKRCNLSCRHCYNNSTSNSLAELPWSYIQAVLAPFISDRLRFLTITGGEPFLHPQFENVIRMAREVAESVNLSTNGTLVSSRNIDYLCEYVDTVNISLDGPTADVHDHFRKCRGAFAKAKRSIGTLANKGVNVAVQTTVFRGNLALLRDLGKLIQNEGASTWSIRLPLPSGRALQDLEGFFSAEEIREREEELCSVHDMGFNLKIYAGISVPWSRKECYQRVENQNSLLACSAGTVLAAILADQRLTPCILFSGSNYSEPLPDPENLKLIWRESPYFKRMREIRLHEIPLCRTCGHYGKICELGCRAKPYLFQGNLSLPDPDCDYYRDRSRLRKAQQSP